MLILLYLLSLIPIITPTVHEALNISKNSQTIRVLKNKQRATFSGQWQNKDITLQLNPDGRYRLSQQPNSKILIYKGYWWIKHIETEATYTSLCFSYLLEVQCTSIQMKQGDKMIIFSHANTNYTLHLKQSKSHF